MLTYLYSSAIKAALGKLGLRTYHLHEVSHNPPDGEIWIQACLARKGKRPPLTREEWDMILGDFNASIDVPGAAFMPELVAAYPEAKVLIHQREFESWYKSVTGAKQTQLDDKLLVPLMYLDTTVLRPYRRMISFVTAQLFGPALYEKENLRRVHKDVHNEVRRIVPKDRLLEFKLAQGWKPLCQFLGREIPKEPFPHLNDAADFKEKCYWMRVTGYRRLWKQWSSTFYLTSLAVFALSIAKLNGFL